MEALFWALFKWVLSDTPTQSTPILWRTLSKHIFGEFLSCCATVGAIPPHPAMQAADKSFSSPTTPCTGTRQRHATVKRMNPHAREVRVCRQYYAIQLEITCTAKGATFLCKIFSTRYRACLFRSYNMHAPLKRSPSPQFGLSDQSSGLCHREKKVLPSTHNS